MSQLEFDSRAARLHDQVDADFESKSMGNLPSVAKVGPEPSAVSSNAARRTPSTLPPPMESRARSWGERFAKIPRQLSMELHRTGPPAAANAAARAPQHERAKSVLREASSAPGAKGGKHLASPRKRRSKRAASLSPAQQHQRPPSVAEAVRKHESDEGGAVPPTAAAVRSKTVGTAKLPVGPAFVRAQASAADVAMTARTMSVDERGLNKRQLAVELGLAAPEVTYNGVPVLFDAETGLPSFRGAAPWMRPSDSGQVRHPDGKRIPLSALEGKAREDKARAQARLRPPQTPRAQTNIPVFSSDGAHTFRTKPASNVHPSMTTSSVTASSPGGGGGGGGGGSGGGGGFLKSLFGRKRRS
jgi:uncharacterized membrane protein YgcG